MDGRSVLVAFVSIDELSLRTAEGGEAIPVVGDCSGLRPRDDSIFSICVAHISASSF